MRILQFLFILTIVFNGVLFSQAQTEFVISADWLNDPANPNTIPSGSDWVNIKDLGLKWGSVILNDTVNPSLAQTALTDAAANGVKLILDRYHLSHAAQGVRWQYHPEYASHYPPTGRVGTSVNDLGAENFPDDDQVLFKAWRVTLGNDSGYIARNLVPQTDQTVGNTYVVKLRMRIDDSVSLALPIQHKPVVTVRDSSVVS